jgi:hypothetical protein
MTKTTEMTEHKRLDEARESFSGRLLTDPQFEEAIAITRIIEREIRKSGAFKDKLGDYAYAMARTEKIDAMKAESTIRDLFRVRTGQTMNQMREALAQREDKLPKDAGQKAYDHAMQIGHIVTEGDKVSFFRAYAYQAQELAADLGITDSGARALMRDNFKAAENRELADWGKELDEQYYRPQIEAEKEQREQAAREPEKPAPAASSYRRGPRLAR